MLEEDLNIRHNRLQDLPVPENFTDENGPEYMTSVVWEPMEHFIHNPERSLSEYGWSKEELRKVNWSAIKVAWQRLFKRWYEEQGEYRIHLGGDGWEDQKEIVLDFGKPPNPSKYNPKRATNPRAIKKDYEWVRNELIKKLGKYNRDDFGLPSDLY